MAELSCEIPLKINKPVTEAFLRTIFNSNKAGPVRIHRRNEIGKYIYSRVRMSNTYRESEGDITLLIPDSNKSNPENHFLYFTAEDNKKINDFLDANFKLFFHLYMLQGSLFGVPFRKKYEALIKKMKLDDNATVYDNFIKTDYRKRKDVTDFLFDSLKLVDN